MRRALGVDVGTHRTGLAIEVSGVAQPLAVVATTGDVAATIAAIAREGAATEIVVGHPIRLDGKEGPAAASARGLADALREEAGLPVVLWDERLTTAQAQKVLVGAGVRRRKRRDVVDKLAATLMLQSYLDAGRQER